MCDVDVDSDVQPKLTGAHGPERPKAAYGRIIALNSADSMLSSESPGLRGPGRAGGALQTPHSSKGGWAGGAPPQRRSRGSRVAGLVSHVCGLLVPRSWLCTRDTTRMSPLSPVSPFVSPAWRVAQLRLSPWDGDMAPMAVPFRMGLESRSWDGEGRAGSAGTEGHTRHGAGLACHSPQCHPHVPVSHTQTPQQRPPTCPVHVPSMCPVHVPPVCPLFDPPQSHPCVPSVSPGPTCVPGVFSHLCHLHVLPVCPTPVPSLSPPWSHMAVPLLCPPAVSLVSHPRVLFMTPCVPPSLPSPTHVSLMCPPPWLPSVPPVCPHIPHKCPLRVSHLCFSFACPLQSLPCPTLCLTCVPPMRPTPVVSLGAPPCLPRFHP